MKKVIQKNFNRIFLSFVFVCAALLFFVNNKVYAADYIYFDLTAGNVTITASKYTGYVYKTTNGTVSTLTVTGTHSASNKYYVYQSNASNKKTTGLVDGVYKIPTYSRVTYNGMSWADYITNHPARSTAGADSVDEVIAAWGACATGATSVTKGAAYSVGRQPVNKYIKLTGNTTFDVTIDNLWSSYQPGVTTANYGGICYIPSSTAGTLYLRLKGDNRFSRIHCATDDGTNGNYTVDIEHKNKMIVTTVSGLNDATLTCANTQVDAKTNHTASAIGGTDAMDHAVRMYFEQGTIYAGSAYLDFCTAIGGGGNGSGRIHINGGTITAIHSSTGTAIGGGCGTIGVGGYGEVEINGGKVYAYSYIPYGSSEKYAKALPVAIGGGSSGIREGGTGIVRIGGDAEVFAYSEQGTAIGGGGRWCRLYFIYKT